MLSALSCGVVRRACVAAMLTISLISRADAQTQATARPRDARLSLQTVFDSVVARFPSLEAARDRARAARGGLLMARTFENPVVNYQVENTPFPNVTPAQPMEREAMLTVSLPLATLYQRGAGVQQARAGVRMADADVALSQQSVLLDAARAYYRTALAQVGVDAAENLVTWLDSLVVYNRARVQQGAAAEADLIRAQIERDRALIEAGMQAAERARAQAALNVFVGGTSNAQSSVGVDVTQTLMALPGATVPAIERADVRVARARADEAQAAASVQTRLRLREFSGLFGVKQMGSLNSMVAGFTVPLPLLDQNRGGIARARAESEAASHELVLQQRLAGADLQGADAAARALTERVRTLAVPDSSGRGPSYLVRAELARSIALGAYREGAVPLMQLLDAARAWGESRIAFFRALYAQHESVLMLLAARGDDIAIAFPPLLPSAPTGATPR